jgi:hypothetical protein
MQLRKCDKQRAALNPTLWTDVPGFPGYGANERGFVVNQISKRVIANTTYKNGYVYVSMRENGEFKNKRLNRIIAITFHPNPDSLPHVNHEDGVKANNHEANLKWSSVSDNLKHAFRSNLRKSTKPQLGKRNELSARSIPVNQFSLDGQFVKLWPSIAEAQRNGFQVANICKVCKGERKSHKGFIWKYKNEL